LTYFEGLWQPAGIGRSQRTHTHAWFEIVDTFPSILNLVEEFPNDVEPECGGPSNIHVVISNTSLSTFGQGKRFHAIRTGFLRVIAHSFEVCLLLCYTHVQNGTSLLSGPVCKGSPFVSSIA